MTNYMTDEIVQAIIDNSEFVVTTVFDKVTVVACQLPNGYVIVEKAVCIDPELYDLKVGQQMCYELIANKIWEMQQYKMLDDVMDIIKPAKQVQHNYFDDAVNDEQTELLKDLGYFDDDTKGHKH